MSEPLAGPTGTTQGKGLMRDPSLNLLAAVLWARFYPTRVPPNYRDWDDNADNGTRAGGWFDEDFGWTDAYGYAPTVEDVLANADRKERAMDAALDTMDQQDHTKGANKVMPPRSDESLQEVLRRQEQGPQQTPAQAQRARNFQE